MKPLPANSEWIIKVTPLQKQVGGSSRVLKEIQGRRSATLRHEVMTREDGETERWLAGNFLLETALDRSDVIPTRYSKSPKLVEKRLSEFPELDWITPGRYRGPAEKNGKSCRLYEYTLVVKPEIDGEILEAVAAGTIEMPSDIVYPHKAWIDIATGFPVASENRDYLYEYEIFTEKDDLNLSLPHRFLQAARTIDPTFSP